MAKVVKRQRPTNVPFVQTQPNRLSGEELFPGGVGRIYDIDQEALVARVHTEAYQWAACRSFAAPPI